jgi:hypothetical protein
MRLHSILLLVTTLAAAMALAVATSRFGTPGVGDNGDPRADRGSSIEAGVTRTGR